MGLDAATHVLAVLDHNHDIQDSNRVVGGAAGARRAASRFAQSCCAESLRISSFLISTMVAGKPLGRAWRPTV